MVIPLMAAALLSCEQEISPEQADQFIKFYGDYLMDEGRDLAALDDGGYAICGTATLPDLGKRMVLMVTDRYGNLRSGFPKFYPETDMEMETVANSIVTIRGGQGGFLLAGYIERPVAGTATFQKDIFLVKVSSNGTESWNRIYGSVYDEVILSATEGISSGFMLAGYKVRDGRSDLLIMGVEQEGDSVRLPFDYVNPTPRNNQANFIITSGNRYLCACTFDKFNETGGVTDILAISFNDDLKPSPRFLTMGASNEKGSCVIEDAPNQFLFLGNRIVSGRSEIVIHQVETNDGTTIVNSALLTTISESDVDLSGERMVKTEDGRYAIVGTRESGGDRQIFLQFLNSDYIPDGQVLFGAAGDQSGADIELSEDGGTVILGTSNYEETGMISLIKTNDTGGI